MKSFALIIIILTIITLVSCIPTTDTSSPALEESPHLLNTATSEPTDGINTEKHALDLVTTAKPEETPVDPTQTSLNENADNQVAPITSEEISTMTPSNIDVPSPNKLPQVQMAVADLTQRLNVSEDEIQVVSFESVTWSDSSMGCPQPGMKYLQVLREGYKIVLDYDGKKYNYHGGETRDPFLCEKTTHIAKPTPLSLDDFITPSGNIDN